MSNESSIFTDASQVTPADSGVATPNTQDHSALDTILASIKNDRGEPKYKSVTDALVALKHSQDYIPQLTAKVAERERELEEERKQRKSLDELTALITRQTQTDDKLDTQPAQVDELKIAEIVERQLSREKAAMQSRENQIKVRSALVEAFGTEQAESKFYEKAQEMGLSKEEINSLAAKSPVAVLQMFGVSGSAAHKQVKTIPTESSVRTELFDKAPSSFIGRETVQLPLGATDQDVAILQNNAMKMVHELHERGLSVDDLTDPRVFFKVMK